MLKISKLTDYGTIVMAYLAKTKSQVNTAKDIAEHTHLSLPTVSKLLKLLTRAHLLVAERGAKGGYTLAKKANAISLAEVIHAVEGDIGLTECSHHIGSCAMESLCMIQNNWKTINTVIHDALKDITLAQLIKPISQKSIRQKIKSHLIPIKIPIHSREFV